MARRALLAMLLAWTACHAAADDLGTLFHTPEERARLDKLRRGEPVDRDATPAGRLTPQALTGFVQRSDGRTTLWVDGNPVALPPSRAIPKLDPKSVRAYGDDPDGVKVERKPAR